MKSLIKPFCMQLFCSARRTTAGSGQHLKTEVEDTDLFNGIRSAAGLIRERGCTEGTGDSCLWLEREEKCPS